MNHHKIRYIFASLLIVISATIGQVEATEWEERSYSEILKNVKSKNLPTLEIHTEEISNHPEEIKECLNNNNYITTLDFSECAIEKEFFKGLWPYLSSCSSLTSLNLENSISFDILSTMPLMNNLRELYLASNSLGNTAVKIVFQFKSLVILDLKSNDISTEGVLTLAESLSSNTSLVKLDLSENNEICDVAIENLAKSLCKNKTLKLLGLAFVNIKNKGAKALVQALTSKNRTLTSLNQLDCADLIPGNWGIELEKTITKTNRKNIKILLERNINYLSLHPLDISLLLISNLDLISPQFNLNALSTSLINAENFTFQGIGSEVLLSDVSYERAIMAIDPAGSGKDEVGYAVVKKYKDYFFLTASGGIKDGHKVETMKNLIYIAKSQNIEEFVVENNYTQGLYFNFFQYVVEKEYEVAKVIPYSSKKEKKERIINSLLPIMQEKKLIVSQETWTKNLEGENDYRLTYQLENIHSTDLKHDDRIDALAIAVKTLS